MKLPAHVVHWVAIMLAIAGLVVAGLTSHYVSPHSTVGPVVGRHGVSPIGRQQFVSYAGVRFGSVAGPVVGELFDASQGNWSQTPLSYAYQWFDCNAAGRSCQPIVNATGAAYTVQSSDAGFAIVVVVTATFSGGLTASQPSTPTGVVQSQAFRGCTFGNSTQGTSVSTTPFPVDQKRAVQITPNSSGQLTTVSEYLTGSSTAGTENFRMAVYDTTGSSGGPGALLGVSDEISEPNTISGGYVTFTFPTSIAVTSGAPVWVGPITGGTAAVNYAYSNGTLGSTDFNPNTYTSGPSASFGTSTQNSQSLSVCGSTQPTGTPVNVSIPVQTDTTSAGAYSAGDTISTSNGTWSNSPTSFNYAWEACDANGINCHPITGASNSLGSCGQTVPGTLATFGSTSYAREGWDTFTKAQASGTAWTNGNDTAPVYTGDQGMGWTSYPDGWGANGVTTAYQPSTVMSVHDGVMDFNLHNDVAANMSPLPGGNRYQTYGAWSMCEKVAPDAGSNLNDFKQAVLLWPSADSNGPAAESDFPEGNFNATSMSAFAHFGTSSQDFYSTPTIDLTQWHVYTQTWGPGFRSYFVDGNLIGTSTNQVWSQPERWQLQLQPLANGGTGSSGHVYINWAWVGNPSSGSVGHARRNARRGGVRRGLTVSGATSPTYQLQASDVANGGRVISIVTASNASGASSAASAADPQPRITQPPSVPGGLTATAGNAQVALTWNASTDTAGHGAAVAGYRVFRATSSGGPFNQITQTTGTNFTDTTPTNGTQYFYEVAAFDNQTPPNVSPLSGSVSATPAVSTMTPGPGTWDSGTSLNAGGETMSYWTYWPKNSSPQVVNGKRALMVALHGCTQDAENPAGTVVGSYTSSGDIINGGENWEPAAEKYGMMVLAPSIHTSSGAHETGTNTSVNKNQAHPSCYTWWGTDQTLNSGSEAGFTWDNGWLVQLIKNALANPQWNIDPNQVYVAGISAGGAEVPLLMCLAPNLIAGGGANSGVSLGQPLGFGTSPPANSSTVTTNCNHYAANNGTSTNQTAAFKTQIFSTIAGTCDSVVPAINTPLLTAGMLSVFGLGADVNTTNSWGAGTGCQTGSPGYTQNPSDTFTLPATTSGGTPGLGQDWKDANGHVRVAEITVAGADHRWFMGSGGNCSNGGTYTDCTGPDYPDWLTGWLFANNLRTQSSGTVSPPTVPTGLAATAGNAQVSLSWNASTDSSGGGVSVAGYNIYRSTSASGPFTQVAQSTGTSFTDTSVTNGTQYFYTVAAFDNQTPVNTSGQSSPPASATPTGTSTTLTPGPGTWTSSSSFTAAGETQTFQLYWPKNPAPAVVNGKRALMLSLHGCTQSSTNVANGGFGWENAAEKYGMMVVAPTAGSGHSLGCWTWWGTNQILGAGTGNGAPWDAGWMVALIQNIEANTQYSIDPNQIYVSGLSAGAAEVMPLICLAPNVFAGGGSNSGVTLGEAGTDGTKGALPPFGDPATMSANCKHYAANNGTGTDQTAALSTQIFSAVVGSCDGTVAEMNTPTNVAGMLQTYGMSSATNTANPSGWTMTYGCQPGNGAVSSEPFLQNPTSTSTLPGGNGGNQEQWNDANGHTRVENILVPNAGHAWFAGSAGNCSVGGTYVDCADIDYPDHLTAWLFAHNLRVGAGGTDTTPPSVPTGLSVTSSTQTTLTLGWAAANDNGGTDAITGYNAFLNTTGFGFASGLTLTFTGLSCGTTYQLGIEANDAAGNTSTPATTTGTTAACSTGAIQHVVWITMENNDYSNIYGPQSYETQLANTYGLATNYYGIGHFSADNYISATSGVPWNSCLGGDGSPSSCPQSQDNIFHQLGSGNAVNYVESGNTDSNHNPVEYYTDLGSGFEQTLPSAPFSSTAFNPKFVFITPNKTNDDHDSSPSTGDTWLSNEIPAIMATPQYQSGSMAIFVTFDESNVNDTQGATTPPDNHVYTAVISRNTSAVKSATTYTHYSLLRTTEELLGLPLLGNAASANSMATSFGLTPAAPSLNWSGAFTPTCNSATEYPYRSPDLGASAIGNGTLQCQTDPNGSGATVLNMTVGSSTCAYQCEQRMDWDSPHFIAAGSDQYISIPVLVPTTFPCSIGSSNSTLVNFNEQFGNPQSGVSQGSPTIGLDIFQNNGGCVVFGYGGDVSGQSGGGTTLWRDSVPAADGKWHDFIEHVVFSTSATTGEVQLWKDGQPMTFSCSNTSTLTGCGTTTVHYPTLEPGTDNGNNWIQINNYRNNSGASYTSPLFHGAPAAGPTYESVAATLTNAPFGP
jgi:poly(3-hydroxybutyrate) depolymerase